MNIRVSVLLSGLGEFMFSRVFSIICSLIFEQCRYFRKSITNPNATIKQIIVTHLLYGIV